MESTLHFIVRFLFFFAGALFSVVAVSFGGTFIAVAACLVAAICTLKKRICRKASSSARESFALEGNDRSDNESSDDSLLDYMDRPKNSSGGFMCCVPLRRSRPGLRLDFASSGQEQPGDKSAETSEERFGGEESGSEQSSLLPKQALYSF